MTTFDVFKTAERIETTAAAIYGAVAKRFADDEKARALFARLEQEEIQHAARVRLLASRYRGDKRILANVPGVAELQACLLQAEAALAEVSGAGWDHDLAATKHRLVQLEGVLSRAHAQVLSKDGDPSLRDFFRQLSLQDDAHAALLGAK